MSEMPQRSNFDDAVEYTFTTNFSQLRSNYLDLFAQLETMIFKVAKKAKSNLSDTAPMHQRIEGLTKLQPSPLLSKANVDKFKEILSGIDDHLKIRNHIVHSVMTFGSSNGNQAALFQNAVDRMSGHQFHLVLTIKDFESYFDLLTSYIRACERIINQPPLQPQPLPGAASGL
jgi:hypothetical protein